ncbi:hypothetical protein Cenrod_2021 [Candidatus Symbiobacter mobilis CR]|uniref:Uncharacterized protein n=1 Tax=Candidatus Symbiobacter mobilis CR TaxID=946483 RepID=U5NCX7_9BURK|nr:hypothetical protein Cenrod_2021 [Candidatus Symbiobacter mobilis CR]
MYPLPPDIRHEYAQRYDDQCPEKHSNQNAVKHGNSRHSIYFTIHHFPTSWEILHDHSTVRLYQLLHRSVIRGMLLDRGIGSLPPHHQPPKSSQR